VKAASCIYPPETLERRHEQDFGMFEITFFQRCTDAEELSLLMDQGPIAFYEGRDPTGLSLRIHDAVFRYAASRSRP
jgi:hypothetical protein